MHSLEIMTEACHEAIGAEDAGENWYSAYAEVVDPASVLELIAIAQAKEDLEVEEGGPVTEEELAAMGKVLRDMIGYIKLTAGSKPDPIRDDLLLQANQLLGLAGI